MQTKTRPHAPLPVFPGETVHIIPSWASGTQAAALCGVSVHREPSLSQATVSTAPIVVCALCEAALELDGMPDKPGTYSQLKLF